MQSIFFLVTFVIICSGAAVCKAESDRHPILLVPGSYGAQIEARLNKTSVPHRYCPKKSDWFTIFLNPIQFIGGFLDCYVENFKLVFDEKTGQSNEPAGVEIRVPGFGETRTIEYLGSLFGRPSFGYMDKLVKALKEIGYESGKDVRGTPFDFRRSPDLNKDLVQNMKSLVEDLHYKSNRSVIIMSHSSGSRLAYYFLKQVSQEWKDKYVKTFISIAGSFGGSVGTMVAYVSGQYDGPFGLKQEKSIELHRTFPGFLFDSPQANVFGDKVIFQSEGKNYTAGDMVEVLKVIGHKDGVKQWPKISNLIKDFNDPGVDLICIKGKGLPTWESINYDKGSPLKPEILRGDGDGIVNSVSADACKKWKGRTNAPLLQDFENIKHLDMVTNNDVLMYVIKQVNKLNKE